MEDTDNETWAIFGLREEAATAIFCGMTTGAKPCTSPNLGTLGCSGGGGVSLGDQLPRPSPARLLAIHFLIFVFPYLSCWPYHYPCCSLSHYLFHCLSRCLFSFLLRSLLASLFCPSLVFEAVHLPRRYWVEQATLRTGWLVRHFSGLAGWILSAAYRLKPRTRKNFTLWCGGVVVFLALVPWGKRQQRADPVT